MFASQPSDMLKAKKILFYANHSGIGCVRVSHVVVYAHEAHHAGIVAVWCMAMWFVRTGTEAPLYKTKQDAMHVSSVPTAHIAVQLCAGPFISPPMCAERWRPAETWSPRVRRAHR